MITAKSYEVIQPDLIENRDSRYLLIWKELPHWMVVDQEAYDLAQKENAAFDSINSTAENDDLKMILWNMAQTEFIRESSKLAEFIQGELNILLSTINRGVKQAPFRVLMRAAMPAVLVEIAFLSNATEEKRMKDNAFLGRVAQSIYLGISKYIYYQNNIDR